MRNMKLRDMKMRHHVAAVENARHDFAAPTCKGGKCEKRDSMEHRMLHMSVHCRAGMHESTRKSTRFPVSAPLSQDMCEVSHRAT